ncbi:hypothetical protein [Staphylococcus aureus]|nr:hypothetical protein [Staphylococcus aureus]
MAAVLIIGTIFFLLIDMRRAIYIGIPLILMVISLLILIGLYAFLFPSFGSLLEISVNLINHLITSRQVRKGKKARSKKTGFKRTRKDGLIRYSSGNVGRLAMLDGRTSKTAFPTEILIQEGIAARYHTSRNRNVTETIITSSQKQSTELQLENMRALIETNDDDAIKDLINLQKEYTDKKIEGQATTFVQYLLMIAPDEQSLEEGIENLSNSVEEGMYYNVQFLNKQDTDKVLSDIKGFK